MRYLVDEKELEPEDSLATYQLALAWAVPRSDRFVLLIEPEAYDDRAYLLRLYALGNATTPEDSRLDDMVQVTGIPGAALIQELTRKQSPPNATSGDLCPVQQATLFQGERRLYACYDYGRTQILDLTLAEADDLRPTLEQKGLNGGILRPAPPYITYQDGS